ncbi:hypothetical protein Tco_1319935 [Tanacetum coccineum]
MRIDPKKTQKEPTYQVVLDVLALTTCYLAFLITAEVPKIYMHQFWFTVNKKDSSLPGQEFDEPPSEDEVVSFIRKLGHKGDIKTVSDMVVDHLHQPWRTFASIINKCLTRKTTCLDKMRFARAQILWGMFYKKNVDFVELLWEDFTFQIENRDHKKQDKMFYPRFTKAIIHHFISKDKSISMRNIINIHTAQDDNVLGSMRFVSKFEEHQVYGELLPKRMTNQKIRDSTAYKTYLAFATGVATPKKARKFKKPASPSKKKALVAVEDPVEKPVKKPAARKQSTGMQIRDTPSVSVSKKKTPATTVRSKGIELLSEAALLEDAQLKKVLKQSKQETHSHQASGSGDGFGTQPKVPDEPKGKKTSTSKGTGTKPGVPDVLKDQSKSENESWGDSGDDESNDEASKEVSDDDDGKDGESDDDSNDDASDDERTESDEDEIPDLNQNVNDKEEEYEEEYVHTPENYESTDDETENVEEEEYNRIDEELYKDVSVKLSVVEHDGEGKGDAEMTNADAGHENKTEAPQQSSSVSSDFASQFLIMENISPGDNEIISMMNVKVCHKEPSDQTPPLLNIPVTVILETSTTTAVTVPPPIPPITPLPQLSTPTPTPSTTPTPRPNLPDFSSVFAFNKRVSNLEKELTELKQADHSVLLLATIKSQIPAMVDDHLDTRIGDSIQDAFQSYTTEFGKKAQAERKRYIDLVEKSVKDIISNESTITESLEDVVLAKSSSQLESTYEAASSLTEFELKKILIDKMKRSQLNLTADEHKELYKALVKSYNVNKDLFEVYGKAVSLKKGHKDKYKDEDPTAGSDQGMKRRKTSKDVESSKGSRSKESKSTSSSKGTTHSQPTSFGKSAQAEEPSHTVDESKVLQNQGQDMGTTDDQPDVKAVSKQDWFKQPERPPTLDSDWNVRKSIDFRPPQTWISKIAQAKKPPLSFDELMSTPIDFSTYVMNHLKIENLTQDLFLDQLLIFLKGHAKNNPGGKKYLFDLSKPLPLIMDRGRQVVPVDYFINNDLEYLKGRSSSRKYTTSTTKTKVVKYDIQGIEDMVPTLRSPIKVAYDRYAI